MSSCLRRGGGGAEPATAIVLAASIVAARGQTIEEKAAICGACHGEAGIPQEKTTPVIWGQQAGYIYLQLRDFRVWHAQEREDGADPRHPRARGHARACRLFRQQDLAFSRATAPVSGRDETRLDRDRVRGLHRLPPRRISRRRQRDLASPAKAENTSPRPSRSSAPARARRNNPGMSDLMIATSEDDLAAVEEYLAGR